MRAISLFSGAGGLDEGFRLAGAHAALACEIDRDARESLRTNLRPTEVAEDAVSVASSSGRGDADLVFGGPPCQGFSVAGKMDPNDERSRHLGTFFDVVERVRPRAFLMENVDALANLSLWSEVLRSTVDRSRSLGYGVVVRVLDASEFGVPQRRKRMFMWGVAGMGDGEVAAAVDLSLSASCRRGAASGAVFSALGPAGTPANPATCSARITFAKKPVMRASPFSGMLFNGAGRPLDPTRPAPTIAASAGGNKTHFVDEGLLLDPSDSYVGEYHAHLLGGGPPRVGDAPRRLRRLTLAESRAFQQFPSEWILSGFQNSQYRQVGNAVPVGLARAVAAATISSVR